MIFLKIIINYVKLESWPTNRCRGINFENGVLLAREDKSSSYLASHDLKFYHRYCLPCSYVKDAALTPIQARFISDICAENN